MKLWLISQTENEAYDTYDSAIVAADTEDQARNITPDVSGWGSDFMSWCKSPDIVKVELIGDAAPEVKPGIVLASFNAG